MKGAPLFLCVIAIGLALGWLVPDIASDRDNGGPPGDSATSAASSAPEPGTAPDPDPAPAPDRTGQWMTGGLSLRQQPDGHFHAETRVNGAPIAMLVDTGASVIALTGADARAIGLHWNESEVQPVARGASGPVMGVPVMLDRVSIGGIDVVQVQAIIVPDGLHISLLGQSFLSRAGPMEVRDGVMTIGG